MSDSHDWEEEISGLLNELADTQQEMLEVLAQKQQQLAGKSSVTTDSAKRETALLQRLQACHERRGELLKAAGSAGAPNASLRALADSLPDNENRAHFRSRFRETQQHCHLIQHRCLTQWLVTQRTLIHLSQLLEFLATGGRERPTYGDEVSSDSAGALMDHNA